MTTIKRMTRREALKNLGLLASGAFILSCGDCAYCLACANNCPQKAIKLRREANPNARYRHPKITLQEIVRANQQHG